MFKESSCAAAVLLGAFTTIACAQTSDFTPVTREMLANPSPTDWLMINRTYDEQRFSPLDQINRDNVGQLQMVWSRGMPAGTNETVPIVYRGVMYTVSPGAGVMAAKRVLHDSRARKVQSPRLTGTQVRRRPSGDTGMPVASVTLSSATRASCSSRILWTGSTLASGIPPVATFRANERVISHWFGALVPSMFMRSPSNDWNGFPASPGSGGAMPSCYGDELASGAPGPAWPTTRCLISVVPSRSRVTVTSLPGGSA